MNMDENIVSRRVTFSCRVERGSMENLTLEWLYANSTSVQVKSNQKMDLIDIVFCLYSR